MLIAEDKRWEQIVSILNQAYPTYLTCEEITRKINNGEWNSSLYKQISRIMRSKRRIGLIESQTRKGILKEHRLVK